MFFLNTLFKLCVNYRAKTTLKPCLWGFKCFEFALKCVCHYILAFNGINARPGVGNTLFVFVFLWILLVLLWLLKTTLSIGITVSAYL